MHVLRGKVVQMREYYSEELCSVVEGMLRVEVEGRLTIEELEQLVGEVGNEKQELSEIQGSVIQGSGRSGMVTSKGGRQVRTMPAV